MSHTSNRSPMPLRPKKRKSLLDGLPSFADLKSYIADKLSAVKRVVTPKTQQNQDQDEVDFTFGLESDISTLNFQEQKASASLSQSQGLVESKANVVKQNRTRKTPLESLKSAESSHSSVHSGMSSITQKEKRRKQSTKPDKGKLNTSDEGFDFMSDNPRYRKKKQAGELKQGGAESGASLVTAGSQKKRKMVRSPIPPGF